MPDLSLFATDKDKEKEGVWVDVHDGLRLRVASSSTVAYLEYLTRIGRSARAKIRVGQLSVKEAEDLAMRAHAKLCLLDWEKLQDGGKDIEHSETEALRLFRKNRNFYKYVEDLASDNTLFQQDLEEAKENLGKDSAGNSNGENTDDD